MPGNELVRNFCDYLLTQKKYSAHTVAAYQNDLSGLAEYMQQQYETTDLTLTSTPALKSWLASLREEHLDARSVNRKLSAAKSFFKFLLRGKKISQNPAEGISSMKTQKKLPVFIEENQLQPLHNRSFFAQGFAGDTDFLIFRLLYLTGMRVSEVVRLKEQDIRVSSNIIVVHGKGNKQRNLPLEPELKKVVAAYIKEKRKLFEQPQEQLIVNDENRPLSRTSIYKIVHRTLAEVTTVKKKSPHVLRHSFATHLSNHGAGIGAIKDLMGHASLAATQVYTHTSIDRLKEIYKKSHPKS